MAKKEILNNDALTVRVDEGPIETVLDAAETVVDIVEGQVDRVVTVTKNNPLILAGVFVVGLSIGGFVAYKVSKKRLEAQFEAELQEQIAAAKSFHRRLSKEDYPTPEAAVEALVPDEVVEAVNSYQGREKPVPYNRPDEVVKQDPRPPVEVVVEEVRVQQNNVFVEAQPDPKDWDYRLEIADREANPEQPYVISFEEFNENEPNHEQGQLTYYAQDDTLADSSDQPIDNTDYTVGDDNLTRFGHGSHDKNVVYVRNERLSMDWEVVRSNGSYQKEVLGFEPEVRHSHRRSGRRQWRADE